MIAVTRCPTFTDWLTSRLPGHEPIDAAALKVIATRAGDIEAVTALTPANRRVAMATAGTAYSRRYIREVFRQAFGAMGADRVSFLVTDDNPAALRFCERLGFRRRGVLPRWYDDGRTAVMMDMLASECIWAR